MDSRMAAPRRFKKPPAIDEDSADYVPPLKATAVNMTLDDEVWVEGYQYYEGGDRYHIHAGPYDDLGNDESGDLVQPDYLDIQKANARSVAEVRNQGYPWDSPRMRTCLLVPYKEMALQAPYVINSIHLMRSDNRYFRVPSVKQTCKLLNIPNEIMNMFLDLLFENHGAISRFAATCQKVFKTVSGRMTLLDSATAEYGDLQIDPCLYKPCAKCHPGEPGAVAEAICTCGERNNQMKEYPLCTANVQVARYNEVEISRPNLVAQFESAVLMTRALHHHGHHIETLYFHKVDFVSVDLLEVLVPSMWKLKTLGVYNCPMINIGHINKLLNIVNKTHLAIKNRKVTLDFFPRFQYGPKLPKAQDMWSRDFGASYSTFLPRHLGKSYSLDIRKAVMALIWVAIRKGDAHGYDIVSLDSALYVWMKRLGIVDLDDTIYVLRHAKDLRQVASMADPSIRLLPQYRDRRNKYIWDKHAKCPGCEETIPGVFYDSAEAFINQATGQAGISCLGCIFADFLEHETDHSKRYYIEVTKAWLKDVNNQPSRALLPEAVSAARRIAATDDIKREAFRKSRLRHYCHYPQAHAKNENLQFSQTIHDKTYLGGW